MKWFKALLVTCCFTLLSASAAQAQEQSTFEAPDKLIARLSTELLDLLKNDQALRSGDIDRIMEVVNSKVMPHLNFRRMAAMAIGQPWRQATEEQKEQLQQEFEMMLIRTYSGALDQIDQNVRIEMLPFRASPGDKEVLVRTEIRGKGNPIELSYRLRLEDDGWKVFNINVAGVWMVENYRSQFQPQLNAGGIDGLIQTLRERNNAAGRK